MSNVAEVVALEDIAMLGSRAIDAVDLKIAGLRTSLDKVFSINSACPHKGGPLSEDIVHGISVT